MRNSHISVVAIAVAIALNTDFANIAWADPVSLGTKLGAASNFVLLGLNNGNMEINSATSITGNVGFSNGTTTHNAQKVDTFTGTAYVHSGPAQTSFLSKYASSTFDPSGGILCGSSRVGCDGFGAFVDTLLDQANFDAVNAGTFFGGLSGTSLGTVNTSLSLTATGDVNVYDVTSWDFNSNTLTLNGDANDLFVFRISGTGDSFKWAQSQTILNGVVSGQILFYFPNATSVSVNKSSTIFKGTILAPNVDADVEYHNPATFDGRIIARNIDVHSDFNISSSTECSSCQSVPEPCSLVLLGSGLAGLALLRRRRPICPRHNR